VKHAKEATDGVAGIGGSASRILEPETDTPAISVPTGAPDTDTAPFCDTR